MLGLNRYASLYFAYLLYHLQLISFAYLNGQFWGQPLDASFFMLADFWSQFGYC